MVSFTLPTERSRTSRTGRNEAKPFRTIQNPSQSSIWFYRTHLEPQNRSRTFWRTLEFCRNGWRTMDIILFTIIFHVILYAPYFLPEERISLSETVDTGSTQEPRGVPLFVRRTICQIFGALIWQIRNILSGWIH
jgi:hypothetical protein